MTDICQISINLGEIELPGCLMCLLCGDVSETPDFIGYYCESSPMFTGTGCFDGGIKRQQVDSFTNFENTVEYFVYIIGFLREGVADLIQRLINRGVYFLNFNFYLLL